jgi:hypothetical protein
LKNTLPSGVEAPAWVDLDSLSGSVIFDILFYSLSLYII